MYRSVFRESPILADIDTKLNNSDHPNLIIRLANRRLLTQRLAIQILKLASWIRFSPNSYLHVKLDELTLRLDQNHLISSVFYMPALQNKKE